jgi:hypothetical protein
MLTSDDYKELAARCTELASESSEPTVAEALNALASDYLGRAAKLRGKTAVTVGGLECRARLQTIVSNESESQCS